MVIGDIRNGTKLSLFKEVDMRATGSAYGAEFKYAESERLFVVNSLDLYNGYDSLADDAHFIIAFEIGPMIYTFSGRLKEKKRASYLVAIEQTGYVKEYNRRKRDRDELLLVVEVFDLPTENMESGNFEHLTEVSILSDLTYDISTSGMCVISNSVLKSKFEPYFLIRLVVTDKDTFILPAKLVRKAELRRTGLGNYEYGFQFIYDNLPVMEKRLTEAIMKKKLG